MTDTTIQTEKPRGPWGDVWAQFRKHRGAMAALVMLGPDGVPGFIYYRY